MFVSLDKLGIRLGKGIQLLIKGLWFVLLLLFASMPSFIGQRLWIDFPLLTGLVNGDKSDLVCVFYRRKQKSRDHIFL